MCNLCLILIVSLGESAAFAPRIKTLAFPGMRSGSPISEDFRMHVKCHVNSI